jgi:formylglycine-generating enzyme required for sulfatase activity
MRNLDKNRIVLVGVSSVCVAAVLLSVASRREEIRRDPDALTERVHPSQGACPPGASSSGWGPDMVRVPEDFCIDKTEVTRGQYEAWLDTSPSTSAQTGACSDNDDFTPSCSWKPGSDGNMPVVCVDWCDAKAFCEAAGKRLCGRIGDGGGYPFGSYDDATVSEWHAACTSGGRYDYPYGNDLDTAVCRGADAEDYTTWGLGEVGSFAGCHSPDAPYSDVYDLSGNAAEWDNTCDGDGPDDGCRIRGGSFEHNEHGLRCAMARDLHWPRMRRVGAIGFRCCAD